MPMRVFVDFALHGIGAFHIIGVTAGGTESASTGYRDEADVLSTIRAGIHETAFSGIATIQHA